MKTYFQIQFKMISRKMTGFGIHPAFGYALLIAGFSAFTMYLFFKTEFAQHIYILVALSLLSSLSHIKRNDFLKTHFNRKKYIQLRLIENLIMILPFVIFLGYYQRYFAMFILSGTAIVLVFLNFRSSLSIRIATPFYRWPFEFTVGFRNTFFMFPIAYFLAFMAISAENFNLGVFSLLLIFLVTVLYYLKPENEYYVWVHSLSSTKFLWFKIKTALIYATGLSLPVMLALSFYFFEDIQTLIIFLMLGYVFLSTIILAKYTAYPGEMNFPQAILIALCLYFPPLLVGVVPLFYWQSVQRLNRYLG